MDIKVTVNPVGVSVYNEYKPNLRVNYTLLTIQYDDICKGCLKPIKALSKGYWNKKIGVKHEECYLNNVQPIEDLDNFLTSW
jgi:hypothetical protein